MTLIKVQSRAGTRKMKLNVVFWRKGVAKVSSDFIYLLHVMWDMIVNIMCSFSIDLRVMHFCLGNKTLLALSHIYIYIYVCMLSM